MDLQIRITATDGSSCVVEVVDNPWYRIDLPNDHWELTSGSLTGVSARKGTFGRFANLLNLHGMARLNFPSPVSVGDTGDGISGGAGPVEWEVIGATD
jgi:hypothetical protein